MANIINAISKVNTDEVAADKPTSEALHSKYGANINALIDRSFQIEMEVFTSSSSWVCPAGVLKVIVVGVGGGGGGGEAAIAADGDGDNGSTGASTTFNGSTVATGGAGGEGGQDNGIGGVEPGRGKDSGHAGNTESSLAGFGGTGTMLLNGGTYGEGGNGGASSQASGAGGSSGKFGIREFTVVPATSYAFVVGAGGAGGSGGAGANGSAGSAGAICLLYVISNNP